MEKPIRYRVTVRAVFLKTETGREWKPVNNLPGSEMAYTPDFQKTVENDVEIYDQQVESLELAALVCVVNGIPVFAGGAA